LVRAVRAVISTDAMAVFPRSSKAQWAEAEVFPPMTVQRLAATVVLVAEELALAVEEQVYQGRATLVVRQAGLVLAAAAAARVVLAVTEAEQLAVRVVQHPRTTTRGLHARFLVVVVVVVLVLMVLGEQMLVPPTLEVQQQTSVVVALAATAAVALAAQVALLFAH